MLLTADIGNTSITLGIFEDNALVEQFRIASDKDLELEEYVVLLKTLLKKFIVNDCIISSVVEELTEKFKNAVTEAINITPYILTKDSATVISLKVDEPDEVGAVRIANATGAAVLYKLPVIAIDFGTATSFDIVNKDKEFIGGAIAPGINLQLKSLNNFTSKLPKIEAATSPRAIGSNTTDAILAGVIRGCASMIDGLVEQSEKELGEKATLIATGGYATIVADYMKRPFDFINPTLTLEGLRYLYYLNKNQIL